MLRNRVALSLLLAASTVACRTLADGGDTGGEPPPEDDGGGGGGQGPAAAGGGTGDGGSDANREAFPAGPMSLGLGPAGAFDLLGGVCPGEAPAIEVVQAHPTPFGGLVSVPYVKAALARRQLPDPTLVSLDEFFTYYVDRLDGEANTVLDARVLITPNEQSATVLASARLRSREGRPAVHVIALTDVSESTGGSIAVRDGALDALAASIGATEGDQLSVIAFGDPPALVLERADPSNVVNGLSSAKDALGTRADSNVLGALSLAGTLAAAGEPTHVVMLTDGGILFDDSVRSAVEKLSTAGHVTSIVQIGRDVQPDAPVFVNADLLRGVAGWGRGIPVFLPASAVGGVAGLADFQARYESIFPIASSAATLEITLPGFLSAVIDVPGEEPSRGPVGYRSAGASFEIEASCANAFTEAAESSLQVSLVGSGVEGVLGTSDLISLVSAVAGESYGHKIGASLPAVVRALRTGSMVDLGAARGQLVGIDPGEELCGGVEPSSCDLGDTCCARADLLAIVDAAECAVTGNGCD